MLNVQLAKKMSLKQEQHIHGEQNSPEQVQARIQNTPNSKCVRAA